MRSDQGHKSGVRAVFPGTFDPFTSGHLNIVERGLPLFDQLVIAVFDNSSKSPRLDKEARLDLIRQSTAHLPRVDVLAAEGLLADWCRTRGISYVLRGIRGPLQLEEEAAMADVNRLLGKGLETVFMPALPELRHISSTLVREIAWMGGSLDGLVPQAVQEEIIRTYKA